MKVAFFTLGCKVNQNETGALAQLLYENGFTPANDEDADIYIVNSCTVTASGDKKSRQWLRRAKRKNPRAVTVLTGCFPQAFPEAAATVAEADIITGSRERRRIPRHIYTFLQNGERIVDIAPHERGERFEELPLKHMAEHTRAFLKIEDGCDRRCAYCVIPRARGSVRSRSEENVMRELEALTESGYREAVFTGINLSSYGKDTGTNLAEIVEKAALLPGLERIRLGSLEPDLLTDTDIARLARVSKLCPQFHLSLQSGSDTILRRMRRVYNTGAYAAVVEKIRAAIPAAVFTTDIIVGFPGETEEDFADSVRFVQTIGFLKVHVFSFSPREGTPAFSMPDQIPEAEKTARSRRLQQAADTVRAHLIAGMTGNRAEVLLETPLNATSFTGYTKEYVPVVVSAPGHKQGDIVPVVLHAYDGTRCSAEILSKNNNLYQ